MARLTAFDLDHTLLKVNISYEFGKHLFKKKVLSFWPMIALFSCYAAHKIGFISMEKIHRLSFKCLFSGLKAVSIQKHVDEFLDLSLSKFINHSVLERKGPHAAILSSSPHFLVEQVGKRLSFDRSFGTAYLIDKEGKFCHIGLVMEGRTKKKTLAAVAMELAIPLKDTSYYTDSILDVEVLNSVGQAVGVSPDRKLKKWLKFKGWEIIDESSSNSSYRSF